MNPLRLIASEKDPLAWLHPFPSENMTPFQAHWHEIAISAVFYFLVHRISPAICSKWVGLAYTNLEKKTKINFDIHVVSMVQCVVSVGIIFFGFGNDYFLNRLADPEGSVFGYNPFLGFLAAVSIGYFIWDLFVCAWYFKFFGLGFFFHGLAALYVFLCSLWPFCLPWTPAFLVFELSTPFLNINWFSTRLPAGTINSTVVAINGILLLISFFSVRIIWGFYAAAIVAYDMYRMLDRSPLFFPVSILLFNVILDSLNVFWFTKMLAIAKKKFKQKSKSPIPAPKTAKID